ncbi:MAG: hypothetical protein RQ966_19780 [Acetobacteraceae bacterium]|nr:hypothetical protein [Acetobacteraceae bacterium]
MQHTQALKRLRDFFRRDTDTEPDALSGPTLIEQEPDLAREASRHNVAVSSWAAGGHAID